jgi:hypothetical protein
MEQFISSNFSFGLGSVLVGVSAFVVLNLGLVIFLGSKDITARAFAVMSFFFVVWSLCNLLMTVSVQTSFLGNIFSRLAYALGVTVTFSLSYCCYVQITKKRNTNLEITYFFLAIILMYLMLQTNYLFLDGKWVGRVSWAGVQLWINKEGPLAFVWYFFYAGPIFLGAGALFLQAKKEQDSARKKQFLSLFWIVLIGFIPPTILSVILPSYGIQSYDWIGGTAGILWVSVTSYILLRKDHSEQVFPVLIVKAELIVIAMIFLFGIGMFY